ncbi:MAG: tripartite tricarboxylate transporter substrate binding protein [Casimicrobiaceae bacterium]
MLSTLASLAFARVASAQSAPQPASIALIVPAPPGGSSDRLGRLVAEALTTIMGVPVHVENVAGNSGVTGTNAMARAPRDGTVLGLAVSSAIIAGKLLSRSARYNPSEDFEWLGILGTYPNAMVLSTKSPWTTLDQFLDGARKATVPLTYASFGAGTAGHLAGSYLRIEENAHLTHVTLESLDEGYALMSAGKLDVLFDGVPNAVVEVPRRGHRIVAVTSAARVPALPDTPSFGELWRQSFVVWIGLVAPKDLAPETYVRLASAVGVLLGDPKYADNMRAVGLSYMGLSGAGTRAFLDAEFLRNAKLIAKLNDEGLRR